MPRGETLGWRIFAVGGNWRQSHKHEPSGRQSAVGRVAHRGQHWVGAGHRAAPASHPAPGSSSPRAKVPSPRLTVAGFTESDRVHLRALDITSNTDRQRVVDEAERAWGGVDVLINNAGVAYRAVVEHISDEAAGTR